MTNKIIIGMQEAVDHAARTRAISAAKEAIVEAAREWERDAAMAEELLIAIRHLNELEHHQ